MNGFFQRGVMQYVSCGEKSFYTTNRLDTFYTMDNHNGSVAVVPDNFFPVTAWAMRSCEGNGGVGLVAVLAGDYPVMEQWNKTDWKSTPNVTPSNGIVFDTSIDIFPNNYPFPVFSVPSDDPMVFSNLDTIYTAIYGSAAGVLGSFKYDGSAYPTLATAQTAAVWRDVYFFRP